MSSETYIMTLIIFALICVACYSLGVNDGKNAVLDTLHEIDGLADDEEIKKDE